MTRGTRALERASSGGMDDTRVLSRLVTGRASRHLRQAALVIAAGACLAVSVMGAFEWQYNRVRAEFLDNPAVHFIDVRVHLVGRDQVPLGREDLASIRDAVQTTAKGTSDVVPVFGFNLDVARLLPDGSWSSVIVYGVPDGAAWMVGLDALDPGVAYSSTVTGQVNLQVGEITVTPSGWGSTGKVTPLLLSSSKLPANAPIALFDTLPIDTVYVAEATYGKIASATLGEPWESIQAQMGAGNKWHLDLVQHILVKLDQLSDVKPVAEAIAAKGYLGTYVLEAFQNIPETLQLGFWVSLSVGALALLVGLVLCVVLVRSYLRLSHKDMGILKHMGCPNETLRKVYAGSIRRMLLISGGVPALLALGLGVVLRLGWQFTAIDVAIPAAMIGGVMLWALLAETPRHTRLPVLDLLKLNREFE